jgi:hypothetical protein
VQVEVAAGAELTGVDIHLARQPRGGSISGVVTGPENGRGFSLVTLLRGYGQPMLTGVDSGSVGTDGHFQFANLEPGTYRLLGSRAYEKTKLYSLPVDVRLEGNDVTGINLVLQAAGEVTGTLEIAGGLGAEPLSVTLEPVPQGLPLGSPPAAAVDQTGAFRVTDVAPSRYRVRVTPLGENGYLKSVRLDGVEAPNGEFDLSRGAQGSLKLVASRNGGQIAGKLLDKEGEPLGAAPAMVLLVADPKEIDLERSLKMADEDGTYIFHAIRPGKYRLVAVDHLLMAGGDDFREAIKKLALAAEEIEIKEGDRKVKDLKVKTKENANAKPGQ